MSRIHEALKKAAEERTAFQESTHSSSTFIDVAAEVHSPSELNDAAPPAARRKGLHVDNQSALQYQELVKKCSHPTWKPDSRMNVFENQNQRNNGSEAFRTLRSRLHQIAATRTLKRILVTSSVPAEGKTFVAANLALSIIRQPDRRVLLIDGDLRSSRLHMPFGAPLTPGLTEYLCGEADEYSVIQSGADDRLFLIPGGSPVANPSELLMSERMKELLKRVSPLFDLVILDSPPAIPVHDPQLLADLCDGTLFVVRAGVTEFEIITRAVAEFEGKNLLGVVLNGVGAEATYGRYYANYGDSFEG